MRIRIIRNIKRLLRNRSAGASFLDLVELRQRLFSAQHGKALCLDRYDLIADHIIVYEDSNWQQPIAYMRSIAKERCQEYDTPLPIELSVSHSPLHLAAYRNFESEVPNPINMGFLCLDQHYKEALGGVKIIELLTWVAFMTVGQDPRRMGLCATINSKFNQNSFLENVGDAIGGIPLLRHPLIPDPHSLTLIPIIRSTYMSEQRLKFGALIENAEWIDSERKQIPEAA